MTILERILFVLEFAVYIALCGFAVGVSYHLFVILGVFECLR